MNNECIQEVIETFAFESQRTHQFLEYHLTTRDKTGKKYEIVQHDKKSSKEN